MRSYLEDAKKLIENCNDEMNDIFYFKNQESKEMVRKLIEDGNMVKE